MSNKTTQQKKESLENTKEKCDFIVFQSRLLRIQDGKHDFYTDYQYREDGTTVSAKESHWMTPLPYDVSGGTSDYWDQFLNATLPDPEDQKTLISLISREHES